MRILHVAPYFPPDRIGGVGEMAHHLHRGLLEAGHDSRVVTAGTTTDDPTVERIARSPLGWTIKVAGLALRAAEFDVVHCHHGEALALAVAMKALRVRTPILATFHMSFAELAGGHRPYKIDGHVFGRNGRSLWYRTIPAPLHGLMDRAMLRLADSTSFISRSSALHVLGPDAGRQASVIYNAVPPLGADVDADAGNEREGILYVGNPSPNKRSMVLPFVLRHVHVRMPDVRLTVVGIEPEDVPELVRLFRAFGQGNSVRWVGRLEPGQVTDFYRRAQVLLVPSAFEGLPMVVLEALRCGTPCVVTRVGGHPEAIEDGVNGFLVGVDDPEEMAERCLEMLSDRGLGERMGRAGRAMVERRFTVSAQAAKYAELYEALIAGARGRRRT